MGSALDVIVTRTKRRLLKVGMSGMSATAIDVLSLIAFVELAGIHVTVAAFLAAMTGGVTNFLLNKYWAFRDPTPIDLRQVASYALVSLVTAMFVAASVHVLAVLIGLPYLVAKAMAAALVFVLWSYPAQAKLVFRGAATGATAILDIDPFDELDELAVAEEPLGFR